jgi:hypothetical protein
MDTNSGFFCLEKPSFRYVLAEIWRKSLTVKLIVSGIYAETFVIDRRCSSQIKFCHVIFLDPVKS